MPRYRVKVIRHCKMTETCTVELDADDEHEAEQQALTQELDGLLEFTFYDSDDYEVEAEVAEIEPEYVALLPDGTTCDWDERLRTVGAVKVPR